MAPDAIFGGDIGCNMIASLQPHDIRHDILTAMLPSGMFIDLVTRAQYVGGQDAPELAAVAA